MIAPIDNMVITFFGFIAPSPIAASEAYIPFSETSHLKFHHIESAQSKRTFCTHLSLTDQIDHAILIVVDCLFQTLTEERRSIMSGGNAGQKPIGIEITYCVE